MQIVVGELESGGLEQLRSVFPRVRGVQSSTRSCWG